MQCLLDSLRRSETAPGRWWTLIFGPLYKSLVIYICTCVHMWAMEWGRLNQSRTVIFFFFFLGWFARPADTRHEKPAHDFLRDFLDEIRADNIRQHLRYTFASAHTWSNAATVNQPIRSIFSTKQEVHSSAPLGGNGAEPAASRADPGRVASIWARLGRARVVRRSALVSEHHQAQLHLRSGPAWQRGTPCSIPHLVNNSAS